MEYRVDRYLSGRCGGPLLLSWSLYSTVSLSPSELFPSVVDSKWWDIRNWLSELKIGWSLGGKGAAGPGLIPRELWMERGAPGSSRLRVWRIDSCPLRFLLPRNPISSLSTPPLSSTCCLKHSYNRVDRWIGEPSRLVSTATWNGLSDDACTEMSVLY